MDRSPQRMNSVGLNKELAFKRVVRCALPHLFMAASVATAAGADHSMGGAAHEIFQWRPFLAPFHAVVLHFPIGFITLAFILEMSQLRRPGEEVRRITRLTIWLSLIAGIISATLGLLRAAGGGYEPRLIEVHRMAGLAVPVLTLATLLAQKFSLPVGTSGLRYVYRGLLTATLALLVVAGHYGGNLTHGSKYLVENAPQFVRELLEDEPQSSSVPNADAAASNHGVVDERNRFYIQKVRPIFEGKCLRCHGPEKQKSGYRLDQRDVALKGGKSEKVAILPGSPTSSHLVELILAKPGSEDIMPPEGKEPLTRDEIMSLIEWIRDGASFGVPPATVTTEVERPSGSQN
jgi:uncharacterized membrane protein